MSTGTIELRILGDGRLRADEAVARAIESQVGREDLKAFFRSHPVLRSTSPAELLGRISRKRADRLLESGLLGEKSFEIVGDEILPRGKRLEVSLPLAILLSGLDLLPPAASPGAIEILHEDDSWLAVAKPADLPSAPLASDEADSVVQRVMRSHPSLPVLRGNPLEPGLVHRLDTGTSGVLLFAKTAEAFEAISPAWNSGRVEKTYRAVTGARPDAAFLASLPRRADLRIGHDQKSKRRMRVVKNPSDEKKIRGEAMRSRTEIVRALPLAQGADLELRIETGLHHQIRVTLAHLGYPILGDSVYGGAPSERLWLHAWRLVLPDLGRGALELAAPLPAEWPRA
jgi:23S rRNA pseudouridine1911/1915/1917 synthase